MTDTINEAARAMGRKGGASKSPAKQAASRANLAAARARRKAGRVYNREEVEAVVNANTSEPAAPVEKLRCIVHTVVAPTNHRPPKPALEFDDLDQRTQGGE